MSATAEENELWRGLGDDDPVLASEFPALVRRLPVGMDRRTVMKLMGASLALAGLSSASNAKDILPYVKQPEMMVPGTPLFYATTLLSNGYAMGVIAETHEGRPTKIEGNPDHPASLGATDATMQAAVLELFDPERSRTPLKNGEPASYDEFLGMMQLLYARLDKSHGQKIAVLIEPTTSPSLQSQLEAIRKKFPLLSLYLHDPLATPSVEQMTQTLLGHPLVPRYHLQNADVILSLDSDFLTQGPSRLAYARDFSARRHVRSRQDTMSQLFAAFSTPTVTSAASDMRFGLRPSEMESLAASFAHALGVAPEAPPKTTRPSWFDAAVTKLQNAGSRSLVIAGDHQSPRIHALALAINAHLGAMGNTIDLIAPPHAVSTDGGLAALCAAIAAEKIDTLLVLGANPVATAPGDLDMASNFSQLTQLIHCGLYPDQTAKLAHWHVPAAHELESWSDARSFDGTASIVQPLIQPLFGGRSFHEILAALDGNFNADGLSLLRTEWLDKLDETGWRKALRDGVIANTSTSPFVVSTPIDLALMAQPAAAKSASKGTEIRILADPYLGDGRHANCAMLQELPHPLTKIVWHNVVMLSPAMAKRLGIANGQMLHLALGARSIEGPAWIEPGHPDGTVTVTLGRGNQTLGSIAALSQGYDAFVLRNRDAFWFGDGLQITVTDKIVSLATTQEHQTMEGRPLVRFASLADFQKNPDAAQQPAAPQESLYPAWPYQNEAWAMSIDLTSCIGCMACVAACQTENNIPTVGPEQCELGHEMHWLRVDRYYRGTPEAPDTLFQPIPCMQCEQAPCEVVCPVNATTHTHDGLNAQVYNRCVGTRYCSQNCPYKVRRFNFLEFQNFDKQTAGPEQAAYNPNVTVRSRGVMEKCTYCVQRISAKRIEAQRAGQPIADGAVVTACQQACPTQAITFGDKNRKGSRVSQEKASPHAYALLANLNTRPRTTYLARIRNDDGEESPAMGNSHD